jgi:autotransporter-associated beta strand protein
MNSSTRKHHKLILRAILSMAVIPATYAVDWDGATGPYTDPTNWVGDVVPDGQDAVIGNGGTAQVVTGNTLTPIGLFVGGHSGIGFLTQSGGEFFVNQLSVGGDDGFGGTGQGTYTISGGSLSAGDTEMWVGSRGGTGSLIMSGDAHITATRQIHFGRDGGVGTGDLSGNAILENTSNIITIGIASPGKTSTLTVRENATLTTADEIYVGWLSDNTNHGVLNIQDQGTVNVSRGMVVGRHDGSGTLNVSGSATLNIGGGLMAGADTTGNGQVVVNDNATVTASWIAVPLNENASGSLTINGGTVRATTTSATPAGEEGIIINATGSGTSRTVNLNGGVLEAVGFRKGRGDQTVDINFNGGVVRAIQDTVNYFAAGTGDYSGSSGFTSSDFDVQAGGLKFDTNAFNVTITQGLNGVGGLTKLGDGVLTMEAASGYLGDTFIEDGVLSITSGYLADLSNVWLNSNGSFDLNFLGVDTINGLSIDGLSQLTGTWGAVGSGAQHESPLFTGSGMLNVTSTAVPEPSTWALVLGGLCAAGVVFRRKQIRNP